MSEFCCGHEAAGAEVCELPLKGTLRPVSIAGTCPVCGEKGKAVQLVTVKAMLAVSLRAIKGEEYRFCRTRSCPVIYFSPDGTKAFRTTDVRERVYQKEPDAAEVYVCYCFRHAVGAMKSAGMAGLVDIVRDIEEGIDSDQCACNLRNPQGSCCLGNVRGLMKELQGINAQPA